jgi:hypothetical protein
LGIALVRTWTTEARQPDAQGDLKDNRHTWSSFVRFRPAAFKTDASVTIAKPMMNATTAFWCGTWRCSGASELVGSALAEASVLVAASSIVEFMTSRRPRGRQWWRWPEAERNAGKRDEF